MRRFDWETRLRAAADARLHKPFEWGDNDCFALARDVGVAVAGVDFLDAYAETMTAGDFARSDQSEADAVIRRVGFGGLYEWIDAHFDSKDVLFATDGDIVGADNGAGDALGVFLGSAGCFITAQGRPLCLSRHRLKRAWATETAR